MGGLKQAFVTGLTEVTSTEKDTLGDIRMEKNKWYKYIRYDTGAVGTGHFSAPPTRNCASRPETQQRAR